MPSSRSSPIGRRRSRLVSLQLLLQSLTPCAPSFDDWTHQDWEALEWDWILERAALHKVGALIAARLLTDPHPPLPEGVRDRLKDIRGWAIQRAADSRLTLQRVSTAFTRGRIPFLVLKGSVLAEEVYEDARLRPFYDLDLAVPRASLDSVEDALRSLGYQYKRPTLRKLSFVPLSARPAGPADALAPEPVARRLYEKYHHHLVFVADTPSPLRPVEVHWRLASFDVLSMPEGDLWQHTRETVLAGTAVRTLDREAMLIHQAVHAVGNGPRMFRLLHLADVAWLLHRWDALCSVEAVERLAARWRATLLLGHTFDAVERLLGLECNGRLRAVGKPGRLSATCFRLAARPDHLVGTADSNERIRRFARSVGRELLWEVALKRRPTQSIRMVAASVLQRLRTRSAQ